MKKIDASLVTEEKTEACIDENQRLINQDELIHLMSKELIETFRLSPQEAKTAVAIVLFDNKNQAAKALAIKKSTLNTHLGSVYDKLCLGDNESLFFEFLRVIQPDFSQIKIFKMREVSEIYLTPQQLEVAANSLLEVNATSISNKISTVKSTVDFHLGEIHKKIPMMPSIRHRIIRHLMELDARAEKVLSDHTI